MSIICNPINLPHLSISIWTTFLVWSVCTVTQFVGCCTCKYKAIGVKSGETQFTKRKNNSAKKKVKLYGLSALFYFLVCF